MATIIDGKALARTIRDEVREGVAELGAPAPGLVALAIGEDESSAAYTRSQAKQAAKLGIEYRLDTLPESASLDDVLGHIRALNEDASVCGIMLQMPLPKHLDASICREEISSHKDVEAVTAAATGNLVFNTHDAAPCTAMAAFTCLKHAVEGQMEGLDVTVVGRSEIVGKPLALLLLHAHCTVTLCHTRTRNIEEKTRGADVVIAAAGRAGLITGDMVSPGTVVIDVGTNSVDGKLVGDVNFEEVDGIAAAITPVPGGVGPVTVAMLMRNLLSLARRQRS